MGCLITEVHTTIAPISADVSLRHVSPVVSVEAKEHIPLDVSALVSGARLRDFITIVPRPASLGLVEFGMVCDVPSNVTRRWTEFMVQEGQLMLSDGKVFRVVDDSVITETYTRLTFLESSGVQHIELDYQLTEDDTIDVLYEHTLIDKSDQFVFGAPNTWWSTYNQTGYARFGNTSSISVSNGAYNYRVQLSKEKLVVDEITTTTLAYAGLTDGKIGVFSGMGTAGTAYNRGNFRIMWFRIKGADGNYTIDLAPVKRDSDGKVGMLDLVSGTFHVNMDDGADFIGGNEVRVTKDYEIIDRVSFNKNKAFNTGFYGNNTTSIDVMFQRTNTSSAAYLFGLTQGNRLTGYLAANSAYWRYGSAYPTFSLGKQKIYKAVVTPGKTTIDSTSTTFTVNEFETSAPVPVGGYKSGTNAITKHYIGYIYYFRMWHGETLLVDWYPCKRLSDGVEGFWDCVSQKFIETI